MTAITFPNSPSVGDTHTAGNGIVYTYDGEKWTSIGTNSAGTWTRSGTTVSLTTAGDDLNVDSGTLFVDASTNRVGVGTSNPDYGLHLHSSSSYFKISNSGTGEAGSDGILIGIDGTGNSDFWNYENKFIRFATNNSERFRITSDGKCGVGTTSPSEKLTVAGHIDIPNVNSYIKGGGHNVLQVDAATTYFYGGSNGVQLRKADNSAYTVTVDDSGNANLYGFVDCIRPAADGYSYLGIGPGGSNEKALFVNRSGEIDFELYSNAGSSPTVSINSNGTITASADATINTLTIGRGSGNVNGNTALGYLAVNSNTSGSSNTGVGIQALYSTTTGHNNTALGVSALHLNTTGTYNVGVGVQALFNNTTGSHNTALGHSALLSNTTGTQNLAISNDALRTNTTGNYNIAIGQSALNDNTTGSQNVAVGRLAVRFNTTGNNNTGLGYAALYANTTGNNNTGLGYGVLGTNTTGENNTASGYQALYFNTTGGQNVAVGTDALQNNTTASYNVAVGRRALFSNTTGSENVAIGRDCMYNNQTGGDNTAVGTACLQTLTSGQANVAYGRQALLNGTTCSYNVALGNQALTTTSTGGRNVAVGFQSLYNNTSGGYNNALGMYALYSATTANYNTAVGYGASFTNTTGTNNVAVGLDALYYSTTGSNNTALGLNALQKTTTGGANVAVGKDALQNNTTGGNNVGIGREALKNATTANGNLGLHFKNAGGVYAPVFDPTTANNRIVMGHTGITNAYVQVSWTVTSDERDKMNFAPVPYGLDFVNQLKPTAFQFKVDRDTEEPNGDVRYGFKAQDILALEGDNPVIIDVEDPDHLKYKGEHLVPVLVNAVQELTTMVKELQAEIRTLKG